jgi:hypothetical protein
MESEPDGKAAVEIRSIIEELLARARGENNEFSEFEETRAFA